MFTSDSISLVNHWHVQAPPLASRSRSTTRDRYKVHEVISIPEAKSPASPLASALPTAHGHSDMEKLTLIMHFIALVNLINF